MPPPTVKGMKISSATRFTISTRISRPSWFAADVEEDEFVRPLGFVAPRDFDRVARVAQLQEVGALDDPAPVDVEARDDALGEHGEMLGGQNSRLSSDIRHLLGFKITRSQMIDDRYQTNR